MLHLLRMRRISYIRGDTFFEMQSYVTSAPRSAVSARRLLPRRRCGIRAVRDVTTRTRRSVRPLRSSYAMRCLPLRAARRQTLRAVVASSTVQKSKNEACTTHSYTLQNGTPILIRVTKGHTSSHVTVSFPVEGSAHVTRADLNWGLFRSIEGNWFTPDGDPIRNEGEMIKTAFLFSARTSSYEVTVDVPKNLLPAYLGCTIHINGDEEILHPKKHSHACVPLGMFGGLPYPKGVSFTASLGRTSRSRTVVNFAVLSRNASTMTLCLVDGSGEMTEIELLPEQNKTGDMWHIAIETTQNLNELLYGWRADGPHGWEGGSRFHPDTILMDPYSKWIQPASVPHGKRSRKILLGSVGEISSKAFNWERAPRPRYGFEHLAVSELDLMTLSEQGPTLEAALSLFLNSAVQMNESECFVETAKKMATSGVNGVILRGAMLSVKDDKSGEVTPLSYFAPNSLAFRETSPSESAHELKTLIKECHKLSMEVFLEVQFCFTGEDKKWMSLKGLDVGLYFRGKGILNCGHTVVHELVLDSLHHWTEEYKVDGFVFDNAETMVQDRDGTILDAPALPEAIASDPLLKSSKLVAVSGDDQLLPRGGERGFPHWGVWTEYNSRFRFDFWDFMVMTSNAKLSNIATRMTGSADLFAACWDGGFPGSLAAGRRPAFGFNSPVDLFKPLKPAVEADVPHVHTLGDDASCPGHPSLVCSLLAGTIVSQGVPVCPADVWEDDTLAHFYKKLLDFRREYLDFVQPDSFDAIRGIEWHGALAGHQPDWDGGMHSHFIGCSLRDGSERGFYVGFNAYPSEIQVQAPDAMEGKTWRVVAYSGLPDTDKEILVPPHSMFHMSPKTTVIMDIIPDKSVAA